MTTPPTIRVIIPLKVKRRNGRPRIVPPADVELEPQMQEPRLLRAIARAWHWRRQLEGGIVATIQDIAVVEKVSGGFIGRMLRLAYLSPEVLERLLLYRQPPAISIRDLAAAADLSWADQMANVFDLPPINPRPEPDSVSAVHSQCRLASFEMPAESKCPTRPRLC